MKKILILLMLSVLFLGLTGCKRDPAPSAQLPEPIVSLQAALPTDAVAPNTMTIDEVLNAINFLIADSGFELLHKSDASVTDIQAFPEEDDILYGFERDDVEIVIIGSRQTDCFTGAYFRSLYDDELTEANMSLYAGLLMEVLEPNTYQSMGEMIVAGIESQEKEANYSGEFWDVLYHEGLINIISG